MKNSINGKARNQIRLLMQTEKQKTNKFEKQMTSKANKDMLDVNYLKGLTNYDLNLTKTNGSKEKIKHIEHTFSDSDIPNSKSELDQISVSHLKDDVIIGAVNLR